MLFSSNSYERKNAISQLVKYCIDNISIRRDDLFEHELFRYQAIMDETVKANLNLINNFVYENVIKSTEVQLLEYKGQRMLIDLFEVLNDNPKTLLPKTTYQKYYNAPCDNKRRVICDYISGMTDNYATKIYKKIFSPDAGSIFDRI
jgi:dGTPase